jgi:acyl-CoA thioesterase-1
MLVPGVARAEAVTLMVVGDSLSAGYGIAAEQGWVNLLQLRLDQRGPNYRVVNASITGDTTRGGLARLPRALQTHNPHIVIIELGGNDGLRGLHYDEMRANLKRMVELSREAEARVLLLGMRMPPNYGPEFTRRYHQVFHEVAEAEQVTLVPFFLERVADVKALMQADGVHPNAEAQPILLDNVWPALEAMLDPGAAPGAGE